MEASSWSAMDYTLAYGEKEVSIKLAMQVFRTYSNSSFRLPCDCGDISIILFEIFGREVRRESESLNGPHRK